MKGDKHQEVVACHNTDDSGELGQLGPERGKGKSLL
jgi:hypothetical protein